MLPFEITCSFTNWFHQVLLNNLGIVRDFGGMYNWVKMEKMVHDLLFFFLPHNTSNFFLAQPLIVWDMLSGMVWFHLAP